MEINHAINYDFRYSHEELLAEIAKLKQYIGHSDVPLIENEKVKELQDGVQNRHAIVSSALMTGRRRSPEWEAYMLASQASSELKGDLALDISLVEHNKHGDAHKTMQAGGGYLRDYKIEMVERDFMMRLQNSWAEEFKQKLAQYDKAQFALSTTLSTGAGAIGFVTAKALLASNEADISTIELTPSMSGLVATLIALGALSARSAVKSGSRQAGVILGSQINASILPYLYEFEEGHDEELRKDLVFMIGKYALRHLEMHSAKLGEYFHTYDFNGREDIAPMIQGAVAVSDAEMHRSYGVNPDNKWPGPWYLSLPSRMLGVTPAAN